MFPVIETDILLRLLPMSGKLSQAYRCIDKIGKDNFHEDVIQGGSSNTDGSLNIIDSAFSENFGYYVQLNQDKLQDD
jgi:hypothetical protein